MTGFRYLFLLLCLFSPSTVDCSFDESGYFLFSDYWCAIHSREKEQAEFLVDRYFNKELMMQYNSTVGHWTGLTPAGVILAKLSNANKNDLIRRKLERLLICVENVDLLFKIPEENVVEPSVRLQGGDHSSGHDNVLVCSAHDFYPRSIRLTWQRNGQEVTEGVSFSEVMSNGDWTYQAHAYLEYTPGSEDGVRCVVDHASLSEPKIYVWDASWDPAEKSFVTGGVCALLLGAVFLSVGLIKYKRKKCDTQAAYPL